jgi:hypothetical protein
MRRGGHRRTATAESGLMKTLLRFAVIFLVAMAVMVGLWSFIAPGYSAAVTGLARPLLHLVEVPNASVLEVRGAEIWIYRIVGPGEIAPFTWFDRYTFFAVIPLLALLVATPGLGWLRRLSGLAGGLGALLLVHAGYLVASVELSYAALGLASVGPVIARTLDLWQVGVRVLWEAAPVAIWILLTFGAWRQILRRKRGEGCRENLSPDAIRASN